MKRTGLALMAAAAVAIGCGGSGPGLREADHELPGFNLTCGTTALWEAATIQNGAHKPAVITAVRLAASDPALRLAWVRSYHGPLEVINEIAARRALVGTTIPPTGQATDGWHVVAGVRMPGCPKRHFARGQCTERIYQIPEKGLVIDYRVGGDQRELKIGGQAEVRTHPPKHACG